MIIAPITLNDNATIISKSSETTGLPAKNLVTRDQPSDAWRTSESAASHWFVVDLGSSVLFNTLALLYANADASSQIRFRAADDTANLTTTPALDSTAQDFWHRSDLGNFFNRFHHVYNFTAVTKRYVRVDITGAGGLSYFQAGNFVAANAMDTIAPRRGFSIAVRDFSGMVDTAGALFPRLAKRRRVMNFDISGRTDEEAWDTLHKLDLTLPGDRPKLFSIKPGDANREMQWTVFGLSMSGSMTHNFTDLNDRSSYEVHELELP